ncbi:Granaticin polyketide synthase putative ketoacyl reductase [Nocardia seriolae]|uniref:Granaticin polyketide synthase putative ketoacyl reductase n=1 Tax=Nocardia seriolae TaxID=37332 RepID=A0ABC8AM73_9NOCA|nr:Granaticin polyketide synthase putative ketoacyl reductase [Nocardia seriolae]
MTASSPAARLPGAHRPVSLVTGPTSGIGKAYATRLASLGYDLVLVARDEDRLAALAHDVRVRFGARAEVLPADLTRPQDRERVARRLAEGVEFLVNNAGFGMTGEFWTVEPDALQQQLDVNVTAVVQLTRAALPPMLHAAKGTVVNVASTAGLIPGRDRPIRPPRRTSYPSRKGWRARWPEPEFECRPCARDSSAPNSIGEPESIWHRCRDHCG